MTYNAAQPKRPVPGHTGAVLSGTHTQHPETEDAAPFPPDTPVPVEVMGWTTTSGDEADESAPKGW